MQLVVKVQTAPNNTDDAAMLNEAVPNLVARTDVNEALHQRRLQLGNGKLPVRGRPHMSMMMVASAVMTNVRRIWQGQQHKRAASGTQNGLWRRLLQSVRTHLWRPAPACYPVSA